MSRRIGAGLSAAVLAIALLGSAVPPADRELVDAAKRGDVAAVRSLLGEGADPNEAQGDGLTALHVAAQQGNLEITEILLGAEANVEAPTRLGAYTALHLASEGAHTAVVRALLEAGAATDAVTSSSGVTPLHLAASALNGESTVKALLDAGAPVNALEAQAGQTPLMFAASSGRTASVRELLSADADPGISTEVVDVLKRMVIDRAAGEHYNDVMTEIRKNSAEGTDRPVSPAEEQAAIAAQRVFLASEGQVDKLLEGFTPDDVATKGLLWQTPNDGPKSDVEILTRPLAQTLVGKTGGMTALLHAAREGQIETVKALLDGGADIDQVSGDGSSPLLIALLNGQFDLSMVLIERGADPNVAAAETDGVSPLFAVLQTQWAGYNSRQPQPRAQDNQETEYMTVLNALLAAGADPNAPINTHLYYLIWAGQLGLDITGATPFWRATFAQDLDAMKALVAAGADPNAPTKWPEIGLRGRRQQDGRIMDDSGIPRPEGMPNMYPIHAAAGGGYMGLGSWQVAAVPNNFLNTLKYLIEEHGADVNLPDSWGYTPLHYASVRGGNDMIEYLVSQGADVGAISVLGQSPVDMARGGRAGYFERVGYPETVVLLQSLGSPFKCLSTLFRGTGDYCADTEVEPWLNADQTIVTPAR